MVAADTGINLLAPFWGQDHIFSSHDNPCALVQFIIQLCITKDALHDTDDAKVLLTLDVKVKNFFSDSPVLPSVSSNSLSEASSLKTSNQH